MRSVLILSLTTAACMTQDPVYQPADCDTPRTYRIDDLTLPTSSKDAVTHALDLNSDGTPDNTLGMVVSAVRGQFGEDIDLEASARTHLAGDTDWKISVWNCPDDARLISLANGTDTTNVHFRGALDGSSLTARGEGAAVPLGAMFDGNGLGTANFMTAETALISMLDPGEETLDATLAPALEHDLASEIIIRAMVGFLDANPIGRQLFDVDRDGHVTVAELTTDTLVLSLLAPDLLIDEVEALSFGIRIRATRVR